MTWQLGRQLLGGFVPFDASSPTASGSTPELLRMKGNLSGYPPPSSPYASEPDAQSKASLAVLTQILLLAAALVVGHVLTRRRVAWLGEAGAALLFGVATGIVCYYSSVSDTYLSWIAFKKEFFFIALLPPIIFEAGYSLETKPCIRNVGAICAYAFLGTSISTVAIGMTMWLGGGLHFSLQLTFIESLLFGSIVSATDPVTVLTVFQRLHADENLYALVFGEAVLNDAVCIVLFKTLKMFLNQPVTLGAVGAGFSTFFWSFFGSMMIGMSVGLGSSLAFKTKYLRSDDTPLESIIVVLCAFSSYMLADGVSLSGIISVLFCGMVMANFTKPNLSQHAQQTSAAFFKMLSCMAETFVFIYIGASLFLETAAWKSGLTWSFLVIALFALAHSRFANIWICSRTINLLRHPDMHVPEKHQFMLWFSGLRGAIAFALSLQAVEDLPGGKGQVILTATYFIILITVLFNGGAVTYLLEYLQLRASDAPHLQTRGYGHVSSRRTDDGHSEGSYEGDVEDQQICPIIVADGEGPAGSGHWQPASKSGEGGPVDEWRTVREVPSNPPALGDAVLLDVADKLLGVVSGAGADLLHKGLQQVRELNRNGILPTLSELDQALQPIFVAEDAGSAHHQTSIEMSLQTRHKEVSTGIEPGVEAPSQAADLALSPVPSAMQRFSEDESLQRSLGSSLAHR